MKSLPNALSALRNYPQFVLWKLVPDTPKPRKVPINPITLRAFEKGEDWQNNPNKWIGADQAITTLQYLDDSYGLGFLFTDKDPFFFVDIDACLENGQWSQLAMGLMGYFPGAAVEVSQSGTGLHIFGKYEGVAPEHAKKNQPLNIEYYTERRFVALTGNNIIGNIDTDHTNGIAQITATYFSPQVNAGDMTEWTSEPVPEWEGFTDDGELIAKALESGGAGSIIGNKASFKALWEQDEDVLSRAFPDNFGVRSYDRSSADAALAQHLSFWTGRNCERIQSLMLQSALVRDKWEREDYLHRTIMSAVSLSKEVYGAKFVSTIEDKYGPVKLKASSEAQRHLADTIRDSIFEKANEEERYALAKIPTARTWIEHKEKSPAELIAMVTPTEEATVTMNHGPKLVSGYQYLSADKQIELFDKCVYVQDAHRILTPAGTLLKAEQFNATYGGYTFQLDESGDKTTRKAWEAFTESQIIRHPKAESSCFRPDLEPCSIVIINGRPLANTYVPVETPKMVGDVSPFITHMEKLLPEERDRTILMSYLAAMVQYKGVKFSWAPLIQGVEGNGKTLFTWCMAQAIGDKYTHLPQANELAEKFNDWLFDKLFIGVEDVYVPDHKREVIEVLKPMITNERLAKRAMQQGQVTADVRANFILNTNHKDAIRKTRNDRRFAIFYTAQQTAEDLTRDGMVGDYFPNLYHWLKNLNGYAMVHNFLENYVIAEEFNPAGQCQRAPETSSTNEAIKSSLGGVEQTIVEAVEEERLGFAGGWISSVQLEKLLKEQGVGRYFSHHKRKEILLELGYVPHPALTNGRVNNPIPIDDNKKPRLFIRKGHINAINISKASQVVLRYIEDQQGVNNVTPSVAQKVMGQQ